MKLFLAATTLGLAQPVLATPPENITLPAQLGPNARSLYHQVFAAIRAEDWAGAATRLDAMPQGPLHPLARALIFTAKSSPRAEAEALASTATLAPDLPQAPDLVRLAIARGALAVPQLPEVRQLRWLGAAPRRGRLETTDEAVAGTLGAQILPLIKDDRPGEAEALLEANATQLSPAALTEWQQRVAWSHYLENDDKAARALAAKARAGIGEWAAQAGWVEGLAAWRQGEFAAAADAFAATARRGSDSEMVAAGHFWAARAAMAARQPQRIQPHLRQAAHLSETFYGMLAQAAMGLPPRPETSQPPQLRSVIARPNVRLAIALVEIGETERADQLLRWQAKIGLPAEHGPLTLVAGRLGLPATQLWLAHNGPAGASTPVQGRYPLPENWVPEGGWRVDRALVFAHALQESGFRSTARSKAGAEGVMQVLPTTAALIDRRKGIPARPLSVPSANIEYGQSYIEQLRDSHVTGGLLPKVIAAYNAGPTPIERWNATPGVERDPLLYIESIPYWETRGYVATVLRNYWMYQQQSGERTVSREALVQGLWPRLPGTRVAGSGTTAGSR